MAEQQTDEQTDTAVTAADIAQRVETLAQQDPETLANVDRFLTPEAVAAMTVLAPELEPALRMFAQSGGQQ